MENPITDHVWPSKGAYNHIKAIYTWVHYNIYNYIYNIYVFIYSIDIWKNHGKTSGNDPKKIHGGSTIRTSTPATVSQRAATEPGEGIYEGLDWLSREMVRWMGWGEQRGIIFCRGFLPFLVYLFVKNGNQIWQKSPGTCPLRWENDVCWIFHCHQRVW
jgi:hypothetical protein